MSWRVVGASVRGSSHLRDGLPCQDAHAWRVRADGWLVLAVADGAGSATHAEVGSATAVDAVISSLLQPGAVDDPAASVDGALRDAMEAVAAEASRIGCEPRDLSTTLIVALVGPRGGAAAQVGDGALVVDDEEGVRAVTVPMAGEFVNETVFLTSPGVMDVVQRASWNGQPRRVAAFTDGLQALALQRPGHTPHVPFFGPLFSFAAGAAPATATAELEAFLAGPRVSNRADDDLTLLLAVCHG